MQPAKSYLILSFLAGAVGNEKNAHSSEQMVAIFVAEILVMLLVGRLLGELMHRLGQPSVMGQLLAGVLIGPSVLGNLWPSGYGMLFPVSPEQKRMIDAISQLGILMLLLLTGMETDIGLVRRVRRAAFFSSIGGIVIPFVCGFILGQYLPASILPDPSQRLVTALFLATALSISSVKIVAMVILEVDFLRRNIGQIILASAIIDDTTGWIIIAMIGGIAAKGAINLRDLGFIVGGTIAFLVLSFTYGRRIVAQVIRLTNDHFNIEMPVITAILVLMCGMALITNYLGVHTVLGAFVVGILIGQSPILTSHIEEQLRGLIVALFAPVFFAVAGLQIDLTVMTSRLLLKLALGCIVIASFGKLFGCYLGGLLGRLSSREATALAIGMNARGSTEVIVATIGLSMGVLNRNLFTVIVVMAITTTMITPPLLRWALTRIPPTGEEKERLEREAAEAKDFVPQVERLLITIDGSENGKVAAVLAGFFAGAHRIMATVLDMNQRERPEASVTPEERSADMVITSAEFAMRSSRNEKDDGQPSISVAELSVESLREESSAAILQEARKGYDMLFLGVSDELQAEDGSPGGLSRTVENVVRSFAGAIAIVIGRGYPLREPPDGPINILVPTTGTDYSRLAGEVAIGIARACEASVTALHVSPLPSETELIRWPQERINAGLAVVQDIQALGSRAGIEVHPVVKVRRTPEAAILRQIARGKHNLLVLGVKARPGEKLFFGHRTQILIERVPCSMIVVCS